MATAKPAPRTGIRPRDARPDSSDGRGRPRSRPATSPTPESTAPLARIVASDRSRPTVSSTTETIPVAATPSRYASPESRSPSAQELQPRMPRADPRRLRAAGGCTRRDPRPRDRSSAELPDRDSRVVAPAHLEWAAERGLIAAVADDPA